MFKQNKLKSVETFPKIYEASLDCLSLEQNVDYEIILSHISNLLIYKYKKILALHV